MNRLFILIITLLLVSCGPQREFIDPSFAKYINLFNTSYGVDVNMEMRFAKQQYPTIAVCISYSDGDKKIEVDPDFWASAEDLEKEEVIFHELGHCLLNRPHRDDVVNVSYYEVPASIMYPYLLPSSTYSKYKEYYINELVDPEQPFTP